MITRALLPVMVWVVVVVGGFFVWYRVTMVYCECDAVVWCGLDRAKVC